MIDIPFLAEHSVFFFHINHNPLHKEISLRRPKSCTDVWYRDTNLEESLILCLFGTIIVVDTHSWVYELPNHGCLCLFIEPAMHFLLHSRT